MSVQISAVAENSIAARNHILPGHRLLRINNRDICDVLDYRFHVAASKLALALEDECGNPYEIRITKREYGDLGLQFETYLIDKQRHCRNKCVFCFIDQLPKGLRESLYFKDDDSRLSFLFGNYITLTNLEDGDIGRIIEMRLSPVNISVHTTNPDLRVKMVGNPRAGEVLSYIPRLVDAGIKVNAQIVLCPGYNDGAELERSLRDLCALGLQSISVVPVGITRFRENLPPMRVFTSSEAGEAIDMADSFGCRPGDEFFLLAGRDVPPHEYYGDYPQLGNGVGMWALLKHEFYEALSLEESGAVNRAVTIATGMAAYPLISELARPHVQVIAIRNDFFGHTVTVAGLVCGGDLINQLSGRELGDELLLPASMLRHERDLFLDGVSVNDVEAALGVPVRLVENDGFELLGAMLK